jgi:hypothetical protein
MSSSVVYLFILENSSHDDKYSAVSYSYNWPSIYTPPNNQSPKLYTLVRNIRAVNLEKQSSIKRQSRKEHEIECEIHVAVEVDHPEVLNNIKFRYIK